MSLASLLRSTPSTPGAMRARSLPLWVVRIQYDTLAVVPRTGGRSRTLTRSLVPSKRRHALLPGSGGPPITHVGAAVPAPKVPLFPLAEESAVVVPVPSSHFQCANSPRAVSTP